MEQAAARPQGSCRHDLPTSSRCSRRDQTRALDLLGSQLSLVFGLLGLHTGPMSTLLTLVVPVGGPVWGGVVPVGTTMKAVRGAGRLLARIRIPATCNARGRRLGQAGGVNPSILIVDDSRPFLEIARRLLVRDGLDVVGTASTGAEAIALVEALRPRIALVDLHLAGESGFDVARSLSGCAQGPCVVLMSTHAEAEFTDLVAASPAAGFVPKERLSGDAIRALVAG